MFRLFPVTLAILGLGMFALSLWFQEGPARSSETTQAPPPATEEVLKPSEPIPPEMRETVPVALEWRP